MGRDRDLFLCTWVLIYEGFLYENFEKPFSSASACSAEVFKCSCASPQFLVIIANLLNLPSQYNQIVALHISYAHWRIAWKEAALTLL